VLPPAEFSGKILQPLTIYSEKFITTDFSHNIAVVAVIIDKTGRVNIKCTN